MAKQGNKNTDKQEKKERTNVYVRGVLIDAFYGKRSFDKGKDARDKYRISIKANPEDMKKLVEAAEPYYKDTEDKWVPKWFTDPDAREFLNLSSNYDIMAGVRDPESGDLSEFYLTDYISDNGNINGSDVVLMVTLKEGAIYPASILIKKLRKMSIKDMFADFEDDDELPFK